MITLSFEFLCWVGREKTKKQETKSMVILSKNIWKHIIVKGSNFIRKIYKCLKLTFQQQNEYSVSVAFWDGKVASVLAFDQAPIMREISTTAFKHSRCSQGVVSVNVCFVNYRGNSSTCNWWYKWKSKKLTGGGKKGNQLSNVCLHTQNLQMNEWVNDGKCHGICSLKGKRGFCQEWQNASESFLKTDAFSIFEVNLC